VEEKANRTREQKLAEEKEQEAFDYYHRLCEKNNLTPDDEKF
jgi:hypothetical protein